MDNPSSLKILCFILFFFTVFSQQCQSAADATNCPNLCCNSSLKCTTSPTEKCSFQSPLHCDYLGCVSTACCIRSDYDHYCSTATNCLSTSTTKTTTTTKTYQNQNDDKLVTAVIIVVAIASVLSIVICIYFQVKMSQKIEKINKHKHEKQIADNPVGMYPQQNISQTRF